MRGTHTLKKIPLGAHKQKKMKTLKTIVLSNGTAWGRCYIMIYDLHLEAVVRGGWVAMLC